MEYSIIVFYDGKVEEFYFNLGEFVDGGVMLLVFFLKDLVEV